MLIRIARRPAVDWFRILAELRRAGMTQCAVARSLGIPRSTVRNWGDGQSPRYDDGRALLMLWRRSCLRMSEKGHGKRVQSVDAASQDHLTTERLESAPLPARAVEVS